MKIGIVGSGMVGATAAYALVMRGVGREIIRVDENRARAEAEADDLYHAVPFASALEVHDGEYQDLKGCRVVIIAAGVSQRSDSETRLQLLGRNAAYHIIRGKGATYYGIGSALARMVEVILHDQRSILTICTPKDEIAGVKEVTVSLPHLLGGGGVMETFPLPLSEDEHTKLHKSASLIRQIINDLDAAAQSS